MVDDQALGAVVAAAAAGEDGKDVPQEPHGSGTAMANLGCSLLAGRPSQAQHAAQGVAQSCLVAALELHRETTGLIAAVFFHPRASHGFRLLSTHDRHPCDSDAGDGVFLFLCGCCSLPLARSHRASGLAPCHSRMHLISASQVRLLKPLLLAWLYQTRTTARTTTRTMMTILKMRHLLFYWRQQWIPRWWTLHD